GELSERLREYQLTPSTQVALIDRDGHAIAHPDPQRLSRQDDSMGGRLASVFDLHDDALAEVFVESKGRDRRSLIGIGERQWIGQSHVIDVGAGSPLLMLLAVPRDEILVGARAIARDQLLVGLLLLGLVLPVVWLLSRALSVPLEHLVADARAIRTFDFTPRAHLRSRIIEVAQLSGAGGS